MTKKTFFATIRQLTHHEQEAKMFGWFKRLLFGSDSEPTYSVAVHVMETGAKFGYKIVIELKPNKWRRSPVKQTYFVKTSEKYSGKQLKQDLSNHLPDNVSSIDTIKDKMNEFLTAKIGDKQIRHL